MPPAIVRTYYPGELWRLTRHTLPDLPSLERELEQVRERGYALNLGEHLAEVYAIGVPVDGRHGRPMAALTVAAPSTRWNRARLAELAPSLSATAAEITRNLAQQSP